MMFPAVLLAAALLLPPPIASAHLARSFDACIGYYPPEGLCRDTAEYLVGDHPHMRATIEPAHSDLRAALWRGVPHHPWAKLATVAINEQGRMAYEWTPQPGDARLYHPYRFRFVIHGHGSSDVVRLWVNNPPF